MGSMNPFAKPKISVPKVKVPTEANSAAEIAAAQELERKKAYTQRGKAATILSKGAAGDDSMVGGLATKRLLGG